MYIVSTPCFNWLLRQYKNHYRIRSANLNICVNDIITNDKAILLNRQKCKENFIYSLLFYNFFEYQELDKWLVNDRLKWFLRFKSHLIFFFLLITGFKNNQSFQTILGIMHIYSYTLACGRKRQLRRLSQSTERSVVILPICSTIVIPCCHPCNSFMKMRKLFFFD